MADFSDAISDTIENKNFYSKCKNVFIIITYFKPILYDKRFYLFRLYSSFAFIIIL